MSNALDAASLHTLLASPMPAFILLQPTGDCPVCSALGQMWQALGKSLNGMAWHARCQEQPFACASLADLSDEPLPETEPRIEIWDGTALERYAGARTPEALVERVKSVMAAARRKKQDGAAGTWQQRVDASGAAWPAAAAASMRVRPIPRLHHHSVATFQEQHAAASTPVIISGALDGWPSRGQWSADDLVELCGNRSMAALRVSVPVAAPRRHAKWAGQAMVDAGAFNVSIFADVVAAQRRGLPLYLFDQPLEAACPALLDRTRAPKYFPVDLQQALGPPDFITKARNTSNMDPQ